MEKPLDKSALSPYKVLDLTDEKGHYCGKILADMGADVIKIEPPNGDPVRFRGPFYGGKIDPEKSLQWWAFNTSKRSVTLDLESRHGQETIRRLTATADFLIESYHPGYMDNLGLGYKKLAQLNQGLIYVSISPFGQTGPYRDYKSTDIISMAMGGLMYHAGDPDRPPLRISTPQAHLDACLHGAAGAMIALWNRRQTGEGQHIDVSIQASIPQFLIAELPFWEYDRKLLRRAGSSRAISKHLVRQIHPCKDGHVSILIIGGPLGKLIRPMALWMQEEGMANNLMDIPWEKLDLALYNQKDIDDWEAALKEFFMRHTRVELNAGALERKIPLTPGNTIPDLLLYKQLQHRQFWVDVEHPELSTKITYPGPPFKLSHTPCRISHRAPRLGEHNTEILEELSHVPKVSVSGGGNSGTQNSQLDKRLPLEGIVVADFTRVLIGPLLGKYLADFGATVIRIESRLALDQHRVTVPYKGEPNLNRSGIFPLLNSSKLSLGLNLSHPKGIELVKKVIAKCDVVLENFVPGMMERWGLAFGDLEKIKPDIVMFRHSMQGQSGPFSRHPGFGWNVNALAGFNHLTGWPDRAAVGPCVVYPDYNPAFLGVTAILAALDYSRRTGRGQYIDISQLEANLPLLSLPILDYTANGTIANRCGNKSPFSTPHNAFRCRGDDRWCAIAVETEEEWKALVQVTGGLAWANDPRFATLEGRKDHEEELDTLLTTWTVQLAAEDVMERLQSAGVPAGVVQSTQDLLEYDPQLKHRRHFQWLEQPDMGTALHQDWPGILSRTPSQIRPAPIFGEHTEYVCTKMLGMSDEEFVELLGEGVVEVP